MKHSSSRSERAPRSRDDKKTKKQSKSNRHRGHEKKSGGGSGKGSSSSSSKYSICFVGGDDGKNPEEIVKQLQQELGKSATIQKKVYPNGSRYIGELNKRGKREGLGEMVFKDGVYKGMWQNGKQNGRGTYKWKSGSEYEGDWQAGKFHGFGAYRWPSGAAYVGYWRDGKKNGKGRFVWANNTKYEGDFRNDKKHGIGNYISGTDGTLYCGEYRNDQMNGWGVYTFADGAKYVGQFSSNNFDGRGTYTTADETTYVGEFKEDQRHGEGLLKTPHLGTFLVQYVASKCIEHLDLITWLAQCGCEEYAPRLDEEAITFEVLPELSSEDLERLGITKMGKRVALLKAIRELPFYEETQAKKKAKQDAVDAVTDQMGKGNRDMRRKLSVSSTTPPSLSEILPEVSNNSSDSVGNSISLSGTSFTEGEEEEELYGDFTDVIVSEFDEGIPEGHEESFFSSSSSTSSRGSLGPEERKKWRLSYIAKKGYRLLEPDEVEEEKVAVGKGVYGVVYRGRWRGADVAVKKLMGTLGEKEVEELMMEATMMERVCHHPNVVNYIGLVRGKHLEWGLVTQFYPLGSMYDILLKRQEKVKWKTIVAMTRDAASGLIHLHKEGVVHRDVAARNCLVDSNWRVVVTDFGLARVKTCAYLQSNNHFGPVAWMAPEALLERKFTEKSDVYSFGVLLWELVAIMRSPYPGRSPYEIASGVIEGLRPTIPEKCPEEFREIMLQCWKQDSLDRPDFKELENKLAAYFYSLPTEE